MGVGPVPKSFPQISYYTTLHGLTSDDFEDLCDPEPEEIKRHRTEFADYAKLKVNKDVDMMQFWLENKATFPRLF